jgi:Predicted nucleotide-binding protein containing TIR-like domain
VRARQNVIFELGYFVSKLGRGRACLLRKGDVEIPSDLYGVIYTEMDDKEGWKLRLVKELKAAKLDFDANRMWYERARPCDRLSRACSGRGLLASARGRAFGNSSSPTSA